MATLQITGQQIEVAAVEGLDGVWHGSAWIASTGFHLEAYAVDSEEPDAVEAINALYALAPVDKPFATIEIDGRQAVLMLSPYAA